MLGLQERVTIKKDMIMELIPARIMEEDREVLNPDAVRCDYFISYLNSCESESLKFTSLQEKWLDNILGEYGDKYTFDLEKRLAVYNT